SQIEGYGASGPLRYSPLMFAALMMDHHFSVSAFCNAESASGVCWSRGGTSMPTAATRWPTAGSASVSTSASLTMVIKPFGVPLGANKANQPKKYSPGNPASSTAGMSGADQSRDFDMTA